MSRHPGYGSIGTPLLKVDCNNLIVILIVDTKYVVFKVKQHMFRSALKDEALHIWEEKQLNKLNR